MIRFDRVLAMTRAEFRLTLRLVRYWVFAIIGIGFGMLGFGGHGGLHYFASGMTASFATIVPRFFTSAYGSMFLWIYLIGVVFLAFDVRARDRRERMDEVLDARALTNLELLLGRWLGLLIASWIPVVVLGLILFAGGSLFGEVPQPGAAFYFLVFQALPTLGFFIALTYLVVLLTRYRIVAALLILILWGGLIALSAGWIDTRLTTYPLYDVFGANWFGGWITQPFASDITTWLPPWQGLLHRITLLLASLGLLALAASFHPRRDDGSRPVGIGIGLLLVLSFVGMSLGSYRALNNEIGRYDQWSAKHTERKNDPAPDLLAIKGMAVIEPARSISLDLILEARAQEGEALESLLFSLNPGYEIESIDLGSGEAPFTFEDGFLEIPLSSELSGDQTVAVHLKANGVPDPAFSYLEGGDTPLRNKISDGFAFLLGLRPLLFEREYVALLDGIRWIPASGADVGREDPSARGSDAFDLDLVVDLPEGMLAAGPGRRREEPGADSGRVRYRFTPGAPLDRVALIAGEYSSRIAEVRGITLEVLVDPDHEANLEIFEEAGPELAKWLDERFARAEELGIAYPYDGLTLAEVPNCLRGYGGGWRKNTTFAQSALVLIRESGFPTARFDVTYKNPEDFKDSDGGIIGEKQRKLVSYFRDDVLGGNPVTNSFYSFFGSQVSAKGNGGVALDYVCETLLGRMVADQEAYFSARIFAGPEGNVAIQGALLNYFTSGGNSLVDAMKDLARQKVAVWDTILEVPLDTLDPYEDPQRTLDVLMLKGDAMASSLYNQLGEEGTAQLLSALRANRAGSTFTRQEMAAQVEGTGMDLNGWLSTWLEETDLAAFVAEQGEAFRLPDAEDGTPRYQSVLRLRNDGHVPGLVDLRTYYAGGSFSSQGPFRVEPESEVLLRDVVSKPPESLLVVPYLSQNRGVFTVLPPTDEIEKVVESEALTGMEVLDYSVPETLGIVVDDLDPGFAVQEAEKGWSFRAGGQLGKDADLDQGIPSFVSAPQPPKRWERVVVYGAYGVYRHTAAFVSPKSKTEQTATFTTTLPESGTWSLEYYGAYGLQRRIPGLRGTPARLYDLTIEDSSGKQEITFDSEAATPGWNPVGEFELADGEVKLTVAAGKGSQLVVADAIRWTPVNGGQREGDQ